ncbi:MAG: hypothetical protein K9L61_01445 [Candidatus Omnitrophica bacterium]|nr:hypothetical protein [Candidatus Omnitrophota bacterium]
MKDLSQTDIKDLAQYKNIIVVIVVIGAALLFIYNAYSGYQNGIAKIKEKEEALQQAETDLQIWKETKNRYRKLADDFFGEDPLAFKKYVEEVARSTGVNINSLKTSRTKRDFYQEAIIQLGLNSSYENLVNFVAGLEKKNVVINSMMLQKNRDKELNVDFSLKAILFEK